MTPLIETLPISRWDPRLKPAQALHATDVLERGAILFLPQLAFELAPGEERFLAMRWSDGRAKNISFDPARGQLRHSTARGADHAALAAMIARFAQHARDLVTHLCPRYAPALTSGLASFRPVAAAGRTTSVTKDDTRVHVDAFASRPNQGRRILRVFCNVNPDGAARAWDVGESFEAVAARFQPGIALPWPGSAALLRVLGVTKGHRSAYDHVMLMLHDRLKRDDAYQTAAPKHRIEFPADSTWIAYTDRVMHAALGGQFMLEQTFYLPVQAMHDEALAPLRVLERLYRRALA